MKEASAYFFVGGWVLVLDDVFDAGICVHSFVANLDFYGDELRYAVVVDFYIGDGVVALVATFFWLLDVVGFFGDVDAGLTLQFFDDAIDVVTEGSNDADAANIFDVFANHSDVDLAAAVFFLFAKAFVDGAFEGFETESNGVVGVTLSFRTLLDLAEAAELRHDDV